MNQFTKAFLLGIAVLAVIQICQAQRSTNNYTQVYPFSDTPNMRYMTSYSKYEKTLFEANPTVYYSFINNFYKRFLNSSADTVGFAVYAHWQPQLRMYQESSKPVKMPSDRIFLGTQFLFKLKHRERDDASSKNKNLERFIGFSLESGHYSNGQSRGAFSDAVADQTKQNDSIYALITPETRLSSILNRKSGNFSTNITELIGGYRQYRVDADNNPFKMHAFKAGFTYYHDKFWGLFNFGGYSDQDIKIYGHWRFHMGYEYMRVFSPFKDKSIIWRINILHNMELIQGAHPSVNPYRSETMLNFFPFNREEKTKSRGKHKGCVKKLNPMKAFGFTFSFIAGHDNYNYRFVDSGKQFTAGITWSLFPPFPLRSDL